MCLNLTFQQRQAIKKLYNEDTYITRRLFSIEDAPHATFSPQGEAIPFLESHGLTLDMVADLENRWNVVWASTWGEGKRGRKRIVYQW